MDIYIYIIVLVLSIFYYFACRVIASVINALKLRVVELERQCRLYQKQLNYLHKEVDNINRNKNK